MKVLVSRIPLLFVVFLRFIAIFFQVLHGSSSSRDHQHIIHGAILQ